MFNENNIYKSRPNTRVQGMSSRQQVLFLMQKTQKEANWNMENDSDFQDDQPQELENSGAAEMMGMIDGTSYNQLTSDLLAGCTGDLNKSIRTMKQSNDQYTQQMSLPYNDEFERKREILRQNEIKIHPERFRLLAHSLTQFTPIKKNKYLERKRYMLNDIEANSLVCTCQRMTGKRNDKASSHQSFNCGDRCINRVVSTECCPWTCPSGPYCKNRRFQLHQDAYVFPVKTEKKGWGLFAGEFIHKGSFVMQYVGEVFSVDSELGQERVKMYKHSTCTYLMRTTNNEVIDPTFVGNIARLINHSCDPNCETQKWNVLGEVCVGIFAIKDIKENEELTFDYQFDFFKTPFTKCYCGATKCKGYLGVLATTNHSDPLSRSGSQISAPMCLYCKKMITEKDSLLICKGQNKEAFHISCVIRKEGGNLKQKAQAFAANLDKRNFSCKGCRNLEKKKLKDQGLKLTSESNGDDLDMTLQSHGQDNDQQLLNSLDMEPDLSLLPWESKDPNVRKYYDDTPENRILDQIIAREFELIEQSLLSKQKHQLLLNSSKKKRKLQSTSKNSASQFSDYYNFMSELIKKLKSRIKQTKANNGSYKFRRQKELVIQSAKYSRKPKHNKLQTEAAVKQQVAVKKGRKRVSAKVERELEVDVEKVEEEEISYGGMVDMEDEDVEEEVQQQSREESVSEEEVLNDDEDEQMNDGEEENEGEENGEEEIEEEMEDQDQIESEDSEESVVSEDEEEEDEDEDEEEEEESSESLVSQELNLEKLQESESEQEEVKVSLTDSIQDSFKQKSLISSLGGSDFGHSVAKFISPRKNSIVHHQTNMTLSGNQGNSGSHHHHTFMSEIQKEKATISNLILNKIQTFVKEQNYLLESKLEDMSQVRETKLNVYESVFNMTVPEFIDDFQCLPNFQIYWDQAWGGMVTVRIISTFKQFNFFTLMLQEFTDLLYKSHLLLGGRSQDHHSMQQQMMGTKYVPIQFPFEIVVVHVPKNFIRKLVGYHEKSLTIYRKNFTVDFDYCRDLLNDEVFNLNENTQLRIFGNAFDVRQVNECIQKDLEQIKMKTIFLQMNDCKIIMDHVKEVKVHVDPCEIRIKKMTRDWKDLRHPFYYLPNYFREIVLIGNNTEIEDAERMLEKFLSIKRELQKVNMQQISYLLPIQFKTFHNDIKQEIMRKYNNHLQIFFYEPTYPRKHLTVLMIGDWNMLLGAKEILEGEVNKLMKQGITDQQFGSFQRFTYHQQIRFSFKSLKRFVLEKDIKYLNHWDMVSIFVENAGKRKQEQRLKQNAAKLGQAQKNAPTPVLTSEEIKRNEEDERDLQSFIRFIKEEDVETCVNTLFVLTNSEHEKLENLMDSLRISKREIVAMMSHVLKGNLDELKDSLKYFSKPGGFKYGGYYDKFYKPYGSFASTFTNQDPQPHPISHPTTLQITPSVQAPSASSIRSPRSRSKSPLTSSQITKQALTAFSLPQATMVSHQNQWPTLPGLSPGAPINTSIYKQSSHYQRDNHYEKYRSSYRDDRSRSRHHHHHKSKSRSRSRSSRHHHYYSSSHHSRYADFHHREESSRSIHHRSRRSRSKGRKYSRSSSPYAHRSSSYVDHRKSHKRSSSRSSHSSRKIHKAHHTTTQFDLWPQAQQQQLIPVSKQTYQSVLASPPEFQRPVVPTSSQQVVVRDFVGAQANVQPGLLGFQVQQERPKHLGYLANYEVHGSSSHISFNEHRHGSREKSSHNYSRRMDRRSSRHSNSSKGKSPREGSYSRHHHHHSPHDKHRSRHHHRDRSTSSHSHRKKSLASHYESSSGYHYHDHHRSFRRDSRERAPHYSSSSYHRRSRGRSSRSDSRHHRRTSRDRYHRAPSDILYSRSSHYISSSLPPQQQQHSTAASHHASFSTAQIGSNAAVLLSSSEYKMRNPDNYAAPQGGVMPVQFSHQQQYGQQQQAFEGFRAPESVISPYQQRQAFPQTMTSNQQQSNQQSQQPGVPYQ